MAHEKQATVEYAKSRGVELWAVEGVHTVAHVTSTALLGAVRTALTEGNRYLPYYSAPVGDGWYLIVYLLQGREEAARRFPKLQFQYVGERSYVDRFLAEGIAAYKERIAKNPNDVRGRLEMAYLMLIDGQFAPADAIYRDLSRVIPDEPDLWENWATCREKLGDLPGATQSLQKALAIAESRTDTSRVIRFSQELGRIEHMPPPAPAAAGQAPPVNPSRQPPG
jgi:tetratricopeptide (TPR) repeat protein